MKYHIAELIDAEKLQQLMQSFYEMTSIPCTLADPQGNLLRVNDKELLGAGWKNICLNFHRKYPASLAKCLESDTVLAQAVLSSKKYSLYKCRNGMVDGAMPIYVCGEHVVNLFTGQFFLEPPDIDYFRQQAVDYGYDVEEYLEALREVPILAEQKVEQGLVFLAQLAELIAVMGFQGHELMDLKNELEERVAIRTAELQKALEEVRTLRNILPLCSFCKKIRDDKGYWQQVDVYIHQHMDADISHSICPECLEKHYPEIS